MLIRVRGKCYLVFFLDFFIAGAVCYPTCIVALDMDLRDPVVLPNGTTADSVRHWMLPTGVEVKRGGRITSMSFFSPVILFEFAI